MYTYQTIENSVENILYREKGSKFIGFLYPISDEEVTKKILKELKKIHPKANHHCYAYRIGKNGEIYRTYDDGEPTGSAGLPIYNQLLAHEITNILLVVVRYFGGTKLGVSGLVKAYKDCAKETLLFSKIIKKDLQSILKIKFNYNQQNQIFQLLNRLNSSVLDFQIGEFCNITAQIKTADKKNISEKLSEMHNVKFEIL